MSPSPRLAPGVHGGRSHQGWPVLTSSDIPIKVILHPFVPHPIKVILLSRTSTSSQNMNRGPLMNPRCSRRAPYVIPTSRA